MAKGSRFYHETQTKNVKSTGKNIYQSKPVVAFFSAVATANTTNILNANASTSDAATTVTTFASQPSAGFGDANGARALVVTPAGTTADVTAGNITIQGKAIDGSFISETIAVIENQSTASSGVKAFSSVDTVSIPAQDDDGATWSVGTLDVIGLPSLLLHGVGAELGTTHEGTAPTFVYDATNIEGNTAEPNSTLDGSDLRVIYYER